MIARYLPLLLLASAVFPAAADWKYEQPSAENTILYNDNGEWSGPRASSLAPLFGPTARVRKNFELDKLPAGTLASAKQAALIIHLGIVDRSLAKKNSTPNRLNEEFAVEINGHPLVFSTADPRFPAQGLPSNGPSDADSIGIQKGQTARQLHDWVELAFPVAWLKPGRNLVELYKKPAKNNDDFVYIGIDVTADRSATFFSFNSGHNWKTGTGSQPDGKGEYLMRLGLSSSPEKVSFLGKETPVDMAPAIQPAKGKRLAIAPRVTLSDREAVIENTALKARFQLKPRLELRSLVAAEADRDLLRLPGVSRLFRIKANGKIYDNRQAEVRRINRLADGFSVDFDLAGTPLAGTFTCRNAGDELRLDIEFINRGTTSFRFMPAFPHLAGIAISDRSADDYFLFPHGGGTLSNRNAALRSVYGTDGCWWQMIDLFSPERGAGIYLRCDDAKAGYKSFALRKGRTVNNKYILRHGCTPGRDPLLQFTDALEAVDNIGMAIDYQEFNRAPGAKLTLPGALLGTHSGNWKPAMARYAAWSKKTWPPRPASPKLAKFWNLHGGIGHTRDTAAYSTKYLNETEQIIEQDSYWTLSKLAPWGSSWEVYDRFTDARGQKRAGWIDPVTGKRLYPLNRGDYNGDFNPEWGGLAAFRTYIQKIKSTGRPLTLYTDPIIACHNTRNGPVLAKKYGIINSDWRDVRAVPTAPPSPVVSAYNSYCLDINAEGYPEWIAREMATLCRTTGADGIRLDEYGHRGYICHAKNHRHIFGEEGQNCWLEAAVHSIQLIRGEFDKINPELVIMTEFPGHDRMAALLDGALSYNTCRRISPLAPLPLNLFRMYFPECKLFEISVNGPPEYWNYAMWNGMGACYPIYPMKYLKVLNRFSDIFSGDFESLVPTCKPLLYANRFTRRGSGKNIYTLFNMTGKSYAGPALTARPGHRYFNLFSETEIPVRNGVVDISVEAEKLGVIGEFPASDVPVFAPAPKPAAATPGKTAKSNDISAIDANFRTRSGHNETLTYHNVLASPSFEVAGFGWRKPGEELNRLPLNPEIRRTLPSGLRTLATHTAGGEVRFTTDARRIAIRAKLRNGFDMNHMPRTGSCGFDIFLAAGTGHDYFFRNLPATREHLNGQLIDSLIFKTPAVKRNFSTWSIYLPLYCGVEALEIGVEAEAAFRPNPPRRIAKPVVFYGSSITQGGCASRPANAYTTLLCRALGAPQINLGFSGNAKGEEAMAKLIAQLDMSVFVMDYDYNSPNVKHLGQTHEKFFRTIRSARPELPIILLSRCTLYAADRTAIIRKTYENAVAAGDRKVWFVEGATLIDKPAKLIASVDGCHPNDLGFYQMFQKLLPVLQEALGSSRAQK